MKQNLNLRAQEDATYASRRENKVEEEKPDKFE